MSPQDFELYRELLRRRSGLVITPDKIYLLQSRLLPIVREHGLPDLNALTHAIRAGQEKLILAAIEAMTTNETSFFRDGKPFDVFRRAILPELQQGRANRKLLRILCAAASTGQEPYSLAMILKEEQARLRDWQCDIVGIDICNAVLEKARVGVYTQFEVQRGMPTPLLIRYFEKIGENWGLKDDIKRLVTFHQHNLLQDLSRFGEFDVIFCRNVLIYFDQETKTRTIQNLSRRLSADGYLFLGGAETLMGLNVPFTASEQHRGVYRPAAGGVDRSGKAAA
jgi:chemotaxis protein methyltransferase CheR